jgi:hypothetical protein
MYAWVFQAVSLYQVSPPKPVYTSPPFVLHACPFQSSRFDHPNNVGEGYRLLSFSLCIFLHSAVMSSLLGPNDSQYPVLRHHQPMFFPQKKLLSFVPIKNKRQNYSSVYPIFIFLDTKLEDEIFCAV